MLTSNQNSIIPTKNIMYGYPKNYDTSKQKDLGTHSNILLVHHKNL